ncbi:MAG: hypothetical protein ACKO9I_05885 [Sphaerospermopsis kisseleviana]
MTVKRQKAKGKRQKARGKRQEAGGKYFSPVPSPQSPITNN